MTDRPAVAITYCTRCHFLARASWVAQELLHTFGEQLSGVTLVPAGGGRFEVAIDGETVFSTKTHGRFPEMRELRAIVAGCLDNPPPGRHASR
jgi:selenoprotein W-related protein